MKIDIKEFTGKCSCERDHHRCTNETDSIRSRTSYGTFLGDGSDQ